jgi:hypothetical protein
MKKKRQVYILVTVLYVLLTMFVLGDTETDAGSRFLIVFLWTIVMGLTAMIVESIDI